MTQMRARSIVVTNRAVSAPRLPRRVAAMVAAAVALSGCFGEDPLEVATDVVGSGSVTETVSAPGRVDAAARQDVAATVSGVVVALEVDDGASVDAGEVVARLDSTQVELARQQAEAARAAASDVGGISVDGRGGATLAAVHDAVRDLDATVPPRLAEARAEAAQLTDPAQRAATEAAIDAVEVSYLTTRAGLLATGQAIAAQQDGLAASLSSALNQALAQATAAQRAQAEAAAAAAEAQADELVLTAPLGGTVQLGEAAASDGIALPGALPPELGDVAGLAGGLAGAAGGGTLRVGAPVVAGQTLFTVFDLSTKYVNAAVDEVDAPQVAIGQQARVTVDAFPEHSFEGIVEGLPVEASTTEAGGVGYTARIRLLDAPAGDDALQAALQGLRVGMTAGVEIAARTVTADLVVPSRALLRREGGTVVFAVRDGMARQVPVEVLALGEAQAAVDGALEPAEAVIVSGYEDLADGDEVVVAP